MHWMPAPRTCCRNICLVKPSGKQLSAVKTTNRRKPMIQIRDFQEYQRLSFRSNLFHSMNIITLLHRRFYSLPSRTSAIRISPLVRASSHDKGLTLLNIQSGKVFLCNRTGSNIWRGLVEGSRPEDVAQQISRQFDVDLDLARQHTFSFVGELERRGLITRIAV